MFGATIFWRIILILCNYFFKTCNIRNTKIELFVFENTSVEKWEVLLQKEFYPLVVTLTLKMLKKLKHVIKLSEQTKGKRIIKNKYRALISESKWTFGHKPLIWQQPVYHIIPTFEIDNTHELPKKLEWCFSHIKNIC